MPAFVNFLKALHFSNFVKLFFIPAQPFYWNEIVFHVHCWWIKLKNGSDLLKLTEYADSSNANADGLIEKLDLCCKLVWRFPVFTQKFC